MVKKILPIVFGLIVFGLGLGASVAWQQMQQAKLDEEEQQTDELVERVPSQPGDVVESVASNPQQTLPIVVRSESLSPEELFRFGEKFKRQEAVLKQQAEQLEEQRTRMKLMSDDIRGAQRELEGIHSQIQDSLREADQLLVKLQVSSQELKTLKQEQETRQQSDKSSQTSVDVAANLERMASIFGSMSPESAAVTLQKHADNGNMELAVQLLANIEKRKAAKVLEQMEDKNLSASLLEATRDYKDPESRNRR